jgi:CheY-like chemotaxis protein/HPt (histidine-containing phosphotransfer) domain-containing protein
VLEEIAQSLASQAAMKELELIFSIDPPTLVFTRGDPDYLRLLLMNLVSYAIKCADRGNVSIQAKAEGETKSYSSVIFSVTFNPGIAFTNRQPTIQNRLGDPDDSQVAEPDGLDSELFLSQKQLKRIGNQLQVINSSENETRITFALRFRSDTLPKTSDLEIDFSGSRVLLVDDDLASQNAMTKMINSLGCRVKVVASGGEVHPALVRGSVTNAPFRVVLLDMEKPGIDVASVLQAVHQDELTQNTKMVLLMSISQRNKLDGISELDRSNYLIKPVRKSELWVVLYSALGSKQNPAREYNHPGGALPPESEYIQKLKILIVEDDDLNLQMDRILFSQLGHNVDVASSGAQALAVLEARDYDLVFMDVQMPEMSGLEATRRIRALENSKKNIPIIALSAHSESKHGQLCLEAGMDGYLSKPFETKRINQIIRACADGQYRTRRNPTKTSETIPLQAEAPLLDVSVGLPYFSNDTFQYDKFLKEFLDGLPKRLENMEKALNIKDWESLGNEAHKLKGISANLGAMQVSNLASQLEASSRESTEQEAFTIMRKIADAISILGDQAPNLRSIEKTS